MVLGDFVIVIDTDLFGNLHMIMDIGALYSQLRLKDFQNFMKEKSFWPDFVNTEASQANLNNKN